MNAPETALQEAWEEAGLIGFLQEDSIGAYQYEKSGNVYHVTVFFMEVTQVLEDWPEIDERSRSWLDVERASQRVYQPGLRRVLRTLVAGASTGRNASA